MNPGQSPQLLAAQPAWLRVAPQNPAAALRGRMVNDSTPEGEFQETVNKSMAMRKAIAMAEGFAK
jgi:hypothetical protein